MLSSTTGSFKVHVCLTGSQSATNMNTRVRGNNNIVAFRVQQSFSVKVAKCSTLRCHQKWEGMEGSWRMKSKRGANPTRQHKPSEKSNLERGGNLFVQFELANRYVYCGNSISCSICIIPVAQPTEQTAAAIPELKQDVSYKQRNFRATSLVQSIVLEDPTYVHVVIIFYYEGWRCFTFAYLECDVLRVGGPGERDLVEVCVERDPVVALPIGEQRVRHVDPRRRPRPVPRSQGVDRQLLLVLRGRGRRGRGHECQEQTQCSCLHHFVFNYCKYGIL